MHDPRATRARCFMMISEFCLNFHCVFGRYLKTINVLVPAINLISWYLITISSISYTAFQRLEMIEKIYSSLKVELQRQLIIDFIF